MKNSDSTLAEEHFGIRGLERYQDYESDPVASPSHYRLGGIETIDFIEAKRLGFHLGNVVKYITRAKLKGKEIEDLRKARWYLDRYIEMKEKNAPDPK